MLAKGSKDIMFRDCVSKSGFGTKEKVMKSWAYEECSNVPSKKDIPHLFLGTVHSRPRLYCSKPMTQKKSS